MRFALCFGTAVLAGAVLLAPGSAAAHGCHAGWRQSAGDGWHSHGSRCEPHRGLGTSKRERTTAKRRPA